MTFTSWSIKFIISIILNIADFFIGRIPIAGSIWDAILGFIGLLLWKKVGGIQFLELLDFTDQIDGFIPSLTISAIFSIKEIWD